MSLISNLLGRFEVTTGFPCQRLLQNTFLSCVNENYVNVIKIPSHVCVLNIYFCSVKTVSLNYTNI